MKTLVLTLFFTLISTTALAQHEKCLDALSRNYTQDMGVFKLSSDDVEEFDKFDEEGAVYVVDRLLKKETPCSISDVNDYMKVVCSRLAYSTVCEVTTRVGYFIVHRGDFGHFMYSVTWGRWD